MTTLNSKAPISLEDWLTRLAGQLPTGATSGVTAEEQAAILELARVAAHTSERISAPISTFLVGVAYASLPGEERASRIHDLTRALEVSSST